MLFLILFAILIVVSFLFVQQLDRRRWHRYQIQRDMYFHQYPYILDNQQKFEIHLPINQSMQRKLLNHLMLNLKQQSVLRTAFIQREAEQKNHSFLVKVMIHDLKIGYLESKYAEQFCQALQQTDFVIGRPIEVMAELSVLSNLGSDSGCRVKLDLPKNLKLVQAIVKEKNHQTK